MSLVAGLALALWQANVARRERDRAERRFNDVRQLSNALLTDIAPKIERLQGSTEARQALVFQSLKYLDSLAQEAEAIWPCKRNSRRLTRRWATFKAIRESRIWAILQARLRVTKRHNGFAEICRT